MDGRVSTNVELRKKKKSKIIHLKCEFLINIADIGSRELLLLLYEFILKKMLHVLCSLFNVMEFRCKCTFLCADKSNFPIKSAS